MPKRRVRISHDIQREIAQVRNRASLKYVNAQRDESVPTESETAALQESERFMQEEGQGDFVPLTYYPTKTSWPANGWHHRRTIAAGYDRINQTLRIQFWTNGAIYDYYNVPPYVAYQFRNVQSPGRYINAVLNGYNYERIN